MKNSRKLIFGKTLLIAFIATVIITLLLVYFTGLRSHRSIIDNSLISLSIFATCFFLFITFGLYNGLNIIDNYSHKLQLSWKNAKKRLPESYTSGFTENFDAPEIDDGIGAIILGIIVWIIVTIAIIILLVLLQAIVWLTMILFIIAIYWVMIRGLKLIFSKSKECSDNLPKSMTYAFMYTILYVGWIYAVVYSAMLF